MGNISDNFLDLVSTEGSSQLITTVSRTCQCCRERTPDDDRGNCSICEHARDEQSLEEISGLVYDAQDIPEVLQAVDRADIVAFDTETTSLQHAPGTGTLWGISLAVSDKAWFLHGPALQEALPVLSNLAQQPNRTWLAFNAPFDLHFLIPHGFNPYNLLDMQVAEYLVDENKDHNLKFQAALRLGIPGLGSFKDMQKKEAKRRGWRKLNLIQIKDIPLSVMSPYAALDARITYDLWPLLKRLLQEEGMYDRFVNIEMPFIRVLERMERRGVCLDMLLLDQITQEYRQKQAELEQAWKIASSGVNPQSLPQLATYLSDTLGLESKETTPTGKPKLDDLNLKRMARKDKTGNIKLLLELRKVSKIISTYLESLANLSVDGRIYTSFNRTGTVSGRLSSSGPNLQNIPIRTELGRKIRRLFIPSPEMELICVDYSQVELRIAAHFSKDAALLDVFLKNRDPHQYTADRQGIDRYTAKTVNYLVFYGGSPSTLANEIEYVTGVRPSYSDAKAWLEGWWDTYPGVKHWAKRVLDYAHKHGFVKTIGGRKRRLEDIDSPIKGIRESTERMAINSPIQGSAADLLEDAMIQVGSVEKELGGYMLLQVHDELVFEFPKSTIQQAMVRIKKIMEEVGKPYNLRVPLRADPGRGNCWEDAKH